MSNSNIPFILITESYSYVNRIRHLTRNHQCQVSIVVETVRTPTVITKLVIVNTRSCKQTNDTRTVQALVDQRSVDGLPRRHSKCFPTVLTLNTHSRASRRRQLPGPRLGIKSLLCGPGPGHRPALCAAGRLVPLIYDMSTWCIYNSSQLSFRPCPVFFTPCETSLPWLRSWSVQILIFYSNTN